MRRVEPIRIGAIIDEIVGSNAKMSKGLCEGRALSAWSEVVGPVISEHTIKISLRDGRMYVGFSTAAARSEFFARRGAIIAELNRKAGMRVVNFIVVG